MTIHDQITCELQEDLLDSAEFKYTQKIALAAAILLLIYLGVSLILEVCLLLFALNADG